jgi:hypothetical protein
MQTKKGAFVLVAAGACALAAALGADVGQARAEAPLGGTPAPDALAIAEEAYVYGYPMMLVDSTRDIAYRGVTNHFVYKSSPPPPDDKTVIRDNVDTLYTSAMLDLTGQPIVIHIPESRGRYYLVPMLDANTNVFTSPGTRTVGDAAHDYVVVGPGWKDPIQLLAGMTEVHAPTNTVWVLGRTQVNGEKDIPAVNAIQRQFSAAPLSEWPAGAQTATPEKGPSTSETPPDRVKSMTGVAFLARLALLLRDNPPPEADSDVLARFARIGLVPGHSFDPAPDLALTIEKAKDRAREAIAAKALTLGENVNGWRMLTKGVGTYGTDYLQRAAVAEYGLGANLPEDAEYPMARDDVAGQPLDGRKAYTLHFEKGKTPPVHAFWSVTLYDKDGHFVPNPLHHYAARDSSLKKNADGSIDIYVQADSPGKAREANWLPAPKDARFGLVLRMYWPKDEVLDGSYKPPGVRLGETR